MLDDVLLVRKNVKMEGDVDGEWCGDNNLSKFFKTDSGGLGQWRLGVQSWAPSGLHFSPEIRGFKEFFLFF